MYIYTNIVYSFADKNAKQFATPQYYSGPLAYGGSGGGDADVVPTGPWAPQIPYLQGLFQEGSRLYNQGPPQAFPGVNAQGQVADGGQLTAGINSNLQQSYDNVGQTTNQNLQGNNSIQNYLASLGMQNNPSQQFGQMFAPQIQQGIGAQLSAGNNALTQNAQTQQGNVQSAYGQVFNQQPNQTQATGTQAGQSDVSGALGQQLAGGGGTNPYLEQLVQGATQAQTNQFNRSVLPGIRSQAQQAGQIGGTRQGIAEGIAAGDLQQNIANTTSNIYGNAFNTQAGLQGQAVGQVLNAQQGDQAAQLDAARLNNQSQQQYIQSLLQGTGQVTSNLGQGLGLGYDAIGTGTSQAGNLFQSGNQFGLQQQLGALGLIPNFQTSSLAQQGAQNNLGLQQYGLNQNSIDALAQQYYFNQNSPFNLLSQYQQYVTGPYGGSTAAQAYNPYQLPNRSPISPQYGR